MWTSKGKGKGGINGLNEYTNWDAWDNGQLESFCYSLKTIEKNDEQWEKPKKVIRHLQEGIQESTIKIKRIREDKADKDMKEFKLSGNMFAELAKDDSDIDDTPGEAHDKQMLVSHVEEVSSKEKRKIMPRVEKWKNFNMKEAFRQHACGGTCRAWESHVAALAGHGGHAEPHGEDSAGRLAPIRTIEPEKLNNISVDGKWEEIELAVDSGAAESVCPNDLAEHVPTVEGAASKRGVMYEVASGHQIPNEGEKRFKAVTEDGVEKRMVLQVTDVNQGLLSVSKATSAGNRVVFDEAGSYIENKTSGLKTWLQQKNGMYMLKLWVQRPF